MPCCARIAEFWCFSLFVSPHRTHALDCDDSAVDGAGARRPYDAFDRSHSVRVRLDYVDGCYALDRSVCGTRARLVWGWWCLLCVQRRLRPVYFWSLWTLSCGPMIDKIYDEVGIYLLFIFCVRFILQCKRSKRSRTVVVIEKFHLKINKLSNGHSKLDLIHAEWCYALDKATVCTHRKR